MENAICKGRMLCSLPEIWQLMGEGQVSNMYKCNFNLPFVDQLNEQQFMKALNKLTLTKEEIRRNGFPIWDKNNCATFFNTRKGRKHSSQEWEMVLQHFYLNPEPLYSSEDIVYVPTERSDKSTIEEDSGHDSSGSTPSSTTNSDDGLFNSENCKAHTTKSSQCREQQALKQDCARCNNQFYVSATDGEYVFQEECFYHWGEVKPSGYTVNWDCCGNEENTRGCTSATQHVWSGIVPGHNGPFQDYARPTSPPFKGDICKSNQGIFALNCEMVFTKNGMEVAKVLMLNLCGEVVYDSLIKPSAPVIDYNTRFSGLSSSDLAHVTKTLKDVQTDILKFVNVKTVLMGHSLENALRALKIVHMNVIDTSILYPHDLGPPLRSSLKELARTELQKTFEHGAHNSAEDAQAVVELVLLKLNDIAWMYSSNPFR